jgi:hypothetical protein
VLGGYERLRGLDQLVGAVGAQRDSAGTRERGEQQRLQLRGAPQVLAKHTGAQIQPPFE